MKKTEISLVFLDSIRFHGMPRCEKSGGPVTEVDSAGRGIQEAIKSPAGICRQVPSASRSTWMACAMAAVAARVALTGFNIMKS